MTTPTVEAEPGVVPCIVLVVDESGSMDVIAKSTRSSINDFLQEQRKLKGDNARVSLIKFNSEVRIVWKMVPFEDVKDLVQEDYRPAGNTALWDGIGQAIQEHKDEVGAIVVIITDGEENSSQRFGRDTILKMIEEKEKAQHWKFVYLGANQDSFKEAAHLGIQRSSNFQHTQVGIEGMMKSLSKSTHRHRMERTVSHSVATDFVL